MLNSVNYINQRLVDLHHWLCRRHLILLGILISIGIFSYITNPFVRFSIVKDPFTDTAFVDGQFVLATDGKLVLHEGLFYRRLALVKSGWHILTGKVSGGRKTSAKEVDEIIAEIHTLRFNPHEPFLISGDHFSVFYPRSLGIFYHSLLDPRVFLNEHDWLNRQELYLKSTAYALKVFSQTDRLSTTIVPVGSKSVALVNIYAPPSDTLYSLLYALETLASSDEIFQRYPFGDLELSTASAQLQTAAAAQLLLDANRESLVAHWQRFHEEVYDDATGLVRTDVLLSGVKDMAKHRSGFYDNVMFWKTNQLAQKLGIIPDNKTELQESKARILQAFWNDEEGHFIEDLSEESMTNKWYSSDWMIAYQTGFLDPENPQDLPYLQRNVNYIQQTGLDQPFGLHYHLDERPSQWWRSTNR